MTVGGWIVPGEGGEIFHRAGGRHWGDDWAEYRWLDFGVGARSMILRIRGKGRITARAEGTDLGCTVFDCAEYTEISMDIAETKGVHTLWLFFAGGEIDLDWFFCR